MSEGRRSAWKKIGASLTAVLPIALIALTLIPMTGCSPTEVTGLFESFFGENDAITKTVREVQEDADYQKGYEAGYSAGFEVGYHDAMAGIYNNTPTIVDEKYRENIKYINGSYSGFSDSYQAGYYKARSEKPEIKQTIK